MSLRGSSADSSSSWAQSRLATRSSTSVPRTMMRCWRSRAVSCSSSVPPVVVGSATAVCMISLLSRWTPESRPAINNGSPGGRQPRESAGSRGRRVPGEPAGPAVRACSDGLRRVPRPGRAEDTDPASCRLVRGAARGPRPNPDRASPRIRSRTASADRTAGPSPVCRTNGGRWSPASSGVRLGARPSGRAGRAAHPDDHRAVGPGERAGPIRSGRAGRCQPAIPA